ncbi:MAG: LysR substrate-binding domain-containing protein [Pseudomonadota bacterium]
MPLRRLPPLNALRAFEAVARCGSFKQAADELHVTPAALSQQVKKLEQDLGVSLLSRQNRNVVPTVEGMRLKTGLTDAFLRIRESVESLGGDPERKNIVVSCGPPVASKWLAPRMGRFIDQHPDVHVSIASKLELVDFHSEDIDVGIRLSRDNTEDLDRTWLYEETVVPLCSPEFAARHRLREPKDILRVPILRDDGLSYCRGPVWELWFAEAGLSVAGANRGAYFGHAPEQAIDAAVAGAGMVIASKTLASADLANQRLVIPFGPEIGMGVRYQLVHRPRREPSPHLDAFKNWVKRELVPYQPPGNTVPNFPNFALA